MEATHNTDAMYTANPTNETYAMIFTEATDATEDREGTEPTDHTD